MAGYLYILEMNNGKYYIWSTRDYVNRIKEHEKWESKSTRSYLPVKLIFLKEYQSINEAIVVELKLKRYKNKKYLEKFINSNKQ